MNTTYHLLINHHHIMKGVSNPTVQIANLNRGQAELRDLDQAMQYVRQMMHTYSQEIVLNKIEALLTDLQQQKPLALEMSEEKEISGNNEEKTDSET